MESFRDAPVAEAGNMGPVIQLRGVEKVFHTGRVEYPALRGVDLEVASGELVAVVGPSGSGKSTILNIITGIDRPTAGQVTVTGRNLIDLTEEELAVWRGEHVGIVFQFFQLLPTLTAVENVMLPLDFARTGSVDERAERAHDRLEQVGLGDKVGNFPAELSGGEQQRVAIAAPWRAIRRSWWRTSQPATSTRTRRPRCSRCSARSTPTAPPSYM